MKTIFEYEDYKIYLTDHLDTRFGERSKLSQAIGCQPAFLSQILNANAHLSQEQALLVSEFLGHTTIEADYFLTLVNYGRAGSQKLLDHYKQKLLELQKARQDLSSRIQAKKNLTPLDQMKFYSSWTYSALHIFLSLPDANTREALAERMNLPIPVVSEQLEFLVSIGLALQKEDRYFIGPTRLHLSKRSPLTSKHHMNWRLKAMDSFDKMQTDQFHYSLVMSLSAKDKLKVRSILIDAMEKVEKILATSNPEEVCVLNADLFNL